MRRFLGLFVLAMFVSCSSTDNTDDIINPPDNLSLSLKWEQEISSGLPQGMVYDRQERPYLFLAAKGGGLIIYNDLGNEAPTQASQVPIGDLNNLHVMNLFQKGNYLYLALGDFFGGSSKTGLAIVDVSNPENPLRTAIWESDNVQSGSAIVTVEGNYAYLGAMEYGFYIFDVSNPAMITEKSNYVPAINYPVENPGSAQIPNARGMTIVGNGLYLCYDAGGVRIIDVTNKEQPNEIGKFHNFEAIETTPKAYNNIIVNGNLAYCAVDYCGVEIWDISDINNAQLIGWWNPWNCETLNNLWWNSPGHANQMVYDAFDGLLYVNTGRSDLSVLDVSNPISPTLKASYGVFDDNLATWGMTKHNNNIYLLYIQASVPLYSNWSGIKKLEVTFD